MTLRQLSSTGRTLAGTLPRWPSRAQRLRKRTVGEFGVTAVPTGLVMSEWFVITGLALALIWSRTTKFLPMESTLGVNQLPGLFVLGGALLNLFGYWFFARRRRAAAAPGRGGCFALLWPAILLATMVIGGAIFAQVWQRESSTFRNLGIYILMGWLVALVVSRSREAVRFVSVYFGLLAVAGVLTAGAMAVFFVAPPHIAAPFHELEFFIIPLVVYVAARHERLPLAAAIGVWAGIGLAVLFKKNSGYLVAIGTIVYLWAMHWRVTTHRRIALQRALLLLFGTVFIVALAATYFNLRQADREFIPSGNTVFRLHMYELAFAKFTDSPLWGTVFSDSPVQEFELYDTGVARNLLPTHSDLLDLLAHGGLVAIGLWLLAHLRVFRAVRRTILGRREAHTRHVYAMTQTLTCMMLLAIVTYAFNPMLLNPSRALLIWSQVGMLAGLACHFAQATPNRAVRP